ncbi:MAG: hypothetical protein KC877_03790 [Candidatus Kaiserbacteria bacterium]|nr:hypothetical protein [Candidatus Kaiserbacteria bacterium]
MYEYRIKRHERYIHGYKELPDGSYVSPEDYDNELLLYKNEVRQAEKDAEFKERAERFESEQRNNEQRIEIEMRNKYFLALATLSAASITLLIQHLLEFATQYTDGAKLAFKYTLAFFATALSFSVVHNFVNTREVFKQNRKEKVESILIGLVAVSTYLLGVGVLIVTVIQSL